MVPLRGAVISSSAGGLFWESASRGFFLLKRRRAYNGIRFAEVLFPQAPEGSGPSRSWQPAFCFLFFSLFIWVVPLGGTAI